MAGGRAGDIAVFSCRLRGAGSFIPSESFRSTWLRSLIRSRNNSADRRRLALDGLVTRHWTETCERARWKLVRSW